MTGVQTCALPISFAVGQERLQVNVKRGKIFMMLHHALVHIAHEIFQLPIPAHKRAGMHAHINPLLVGVCGGGNDLWVETHIPQVLAQRIYCFLDIGRTEPLVDKLRSGLLSNLLR